MCGLWLIAGFKLKMHEIHEILLFEFLLAFSVMKVGSWFGNVQNSVARISLSTCDQ